MASSDRTPAPESSWRRRSAPARRSSPSCLARDDALDGHGRLARCCPKHEINNPVAFINASVYLIHEAAARVQRELDGHIDPPVLATLQRLLENAEICRDGARAARIVRELQAFARVQPNHREPVDVHAALERSLSLLRGEYKDRVTIVRDFGDLPRPQANPGEIDQVLMNLLSNAVQAIDGPGEVRLRTWAEDGSVCVEVRDSGCGIPPEIQDRIFEPFFTTRTGRGTGLGLAIAHSLVVRHGGELEVSSGLGHGTAFVVRLPLDVPALREPIA